MIENAASYEFKSLFRGSLLSYLVGFYVFAFYLEIQHRINFLEAIRFQFSYGAVVGALCLHKYLTDNTRAPTLNSVTKTVFLLIFIMGIYTVFSMDIEESIKVYNDRVIKFALISFFIYSGTSKIEDLRVILAFILLAWLKMGLEGFIGWHSGSLVWENQGIPRLHGSTSMYGHPNSFSGFAVGCLPFASLLLMCVKNRILQLGLLAILGFSLLIIVTTGSRTGYVAVVLGSLYLFSQLKTSKSKIFIFMLLSMIAAMIFVPSEYKERFNSIFSGEEKEGHSSERRMEIIEDAIVIYKKYPLGIGLQAFPKVRDNMFGRSQNTHNLYLEVLTNIGPIGFIVFSIFVFKLITLNTQNIKTLASHQIENINKEFLINLSKATIGYILMRLLLGLFGMDLYEIYWWVALGLTLAITKLSKDIIQ